MIGQPEEDIERKLAQLDESARHGGLRDMRHGPLKWLVAAACAAAAAALVIFILEANKPPAPGPIPPKPVMIEVLPRK